MRVVSNRRVVVLFLKLYDVSAIYLYGLTQKKIFFALLLPPVSKFSHRIPELSEILTFGGKL